jgi:hypothetical protein
MQSNKNYTVGKTKDITEKQKIDQGQLSFIFGFASPLLQPGMGFSGE